jgi:hypothetical protein
MKILFSLLLLGMCVLSAFAQIPNIEPGVSHELAAWRAAHYSDVRYKLNLTLEKMSPVLRGTIEIRVTVTEPESIPPSVDSSQFADQTTHSIILDWRKLAGHEKDSAISNTTINGTALVLWTTYKSPVGKNYPTMHYREIFPNYREVGKYLIFRDGVVPGENVIKLDFTSPILTSGSAITRYIDKEDGSEYVYSLLSPLNASTAFPMFNQPDLRVRFELTTFVPMKEGGLLWKIVSNTNMKARMVGGRYNLHDPLHESEDIPWVITNFEETKPISPYDFAFAAGPWQELNADRMPDRNTIPMDKQKTCCWDPGLTDSDIEGFPTEKTKSNTSTAKDGQTNNEAGGNPSGSEGATNSAEKNTLPTGRVSASVAESPSTHIYVRKSQTAKIQPHATDIFKMARESNRYLNDKSAWPKNDLVLIPDLPSEMVQAAGITFVRESSIIHEK